MFIYATDIIGSNTLLPIESETSVENIQEEIKISIVKKYSIKEAILMVLLVYIVYAMIIRTIAMFASEYKTKFNDMKSKFKQYPHILFELFPTFSPVANLSLSSPNMTMKILCVIMSFLPLITTALSIFLVYKLHLSHKLKILIPIIMYTFLILFFFLFAHFAKISSSSYSPSFLSFLSLTSSFPTIDKLI